MRGSSREYQNTSLFFKRLARKKAVDNSLVDEEREQYYSFLNIFINQMTANMLPLSDLLSFASVDRRARFDAINAMGVALFFQSVYRGRLLALDDAKEALATEFDDKMQRQTALARRRGTIPDEYLDLGANRRCLRRIIPPFCLFLLSAPATVSYLSSDASFDDFVGYRADDVFRGSLVVIAAGLVLCSLALGLLTYSLRGVRYTQGEYNAFLAGISRLQLPDRLPENEKACLAAFDKLILAEKRIDKKISFFRSFRDIEEQRLESTAPLLVTRL